MAKSGTHKERRRRPLQAWSTPRARSRWFWLGIGGLAIAVVLAWYLWRGSLDAWQGIERLTGEIAGGIFFIACFYSLRRRLWKRLPGKLESWLWMHIGLGILLIPLLWLHAQNILLNNPSCLQVSCFTEAYAGRAALLAVLIVLITGFSVRIADRWQGRLIARDAQTNGIGLISALEARLAEIDFAIERLCAGKSSEFVDYCWYELTGPQRSRPRPELAKSERSDFRNVLAQLGERTSVLLSIKIQKRAIRRMRFWRQVHTLFSIIAACLLIYHLAMSAIMHWHIQIHL